MFKRRDWVHMHGQDGEGSSDDDSSDGSEVSERESSASGSDASDSGSEAEEPAQSDVAEESAELPEARRLQDLSEDDFEEADEPRVDVVELVQTWLTSPEPELLKGPPLRCRWCPGTLLLNAIALKNHVESKRHQRRHKPDEDQPQPICLAEDMQEAESEGETHAERLERLRQLSAPPQLSKLSASQRRRMIRKLKAEQRSKLPKVKPGKRQRAEIKAQVFGSAGGRSDKQKQNKQNLESVQNAKEMKKKAKKAKKQKIKRQKQQKV